MCIPPISAAAPNAALIKKSDNKVTVTTLNCLWDNYAKN